MIPKIKPPSLHSETAQPWGKPAGDPPPPPQDNQPGPGSRRSLWSILFVVLLIATYGISAYQDISSPGSLSYWKDYFGSPSMTASAVTMTDGRKGLAIQGEIGPASASWFREQLDAAKMTSGDVVFLSSPGGSLNQGLIMGAVVRSRGLTTVVGKVDSSGRPQPARCASACVFVFAGGKVREAMPRSLLGVHQFSTTGAKREESASDIVSRTQRTTGIILDYMTEMGVSSSIMQAMTASKDIRWLTEQEAFDFNLVTARYALPLPQTGR